MPCLSHFQASLKMFLKAQFKLLPAAMETKEFGFTVVPPAWPGAPNNFIGLVVGGRVSFAVLATATGW